MTVGRRGRRAPLVVALALAAFVILASCRERGEDAARRPVAAPVTPVTTSGGDITVVGHIARAFGMYVLQLGSTTPEPLIVVLRRPEPLSVGQRVEVTGEVRTFHRAELEAELAVALGPEATSVEGQRCLLANSVRLE